MPVGWEDIEDYRRAHPLQDEHDRIYMWQDLNSWHNRHAKPRPKQHRDFKSLKDVLGGGIKAMAERNIRRRKRLIAEGKIETEHTMADRPMRKRKRRRRETREQFIARRKRELKGN